MLDRLAKGGRHGEDAWITARDNRHVDALGRACESRLGPRDFLAIVGGVRDLAVFQLQPVQIGLIAVELARDAYGFHRLRRRLVGIAGTEADHEKPPAHGLFSQPGTSTSAK